MLTLGLIVEKLLNLREYLKQPLPFLPSSQSSIDRPYEKERKTHPTCVTQIDDEVNFVRDKLHTYLRVSLTTFSLLLTQYAWKWSCSQDHAGSALCFWAPRPNLCKRSDIYYFSRRMCRCECSLFLDHQHLFCPKVIYSSCAGLACPRRIQSHRLW